MLWELAQHVAEKENLKDSVIKISKIIGEESWERRRGSRQRRKRSEIGRKNRLTQGERSS